MRRKSYSLMAVTFAFTLILPACSSTSIVEQWADPDQKTAFNHLLVLSLNHSDSKRRVFESGFIAELDKRNIEATASYELLPDKTDLSTETIKAAIAGTDIDAALVMRQVRIKKEERYVQPRYDYMGDPFLRFLLRLLRALCADLHSGLCHRGHHRAS